MSHPAGPIMLYAAVIVGLTVLAIRETKRRHK